MTNKKTEIITFRTTAETKKKLDAEASKKNLSIAKLLDIIIKDYLDNALAYDEDFARTILSKILSKEIKTIQDLVRWAINNNVVTQIAPTMPLWTEIIKEQNNTL